MAKTLSFVKGKGSLRHNNRDFVASNIDKSRLEWNRYYIQQPLKEAYQEIFGKAVEEYNFRQKRNDRKIDDYLNNIKNSGNKEKQFYEIVVQVGKKDDTGVVDENGNLSETARQAQEVLDEYARTFQERNPNLILFNAVLHMDEATPHLHLDYIPVAHGYKTGLKTRNSLTKTFQEMGIAPAVSKTDTETMHWQERERNHLMELCQDKGIEIEVLGVERDSYSIPEYKQAMREKESAEAEIEILKSEKIEIAEAIAGMDSELESGKKEIEEQLENLTDINNRIAEAKKKIEAKNKVLDKIMDAERPVEKEIKDILDQTSVSTPIFGGEPTVKVPKSIFDKMVTRYRVSGTFENLNWQYVRILESKDKKIDELINEIQKLKDLYVKCQEFLKSHNLMDMFKEFIRPKTVREKLVIGKEKVAENDRTNTKVKSITDKKCDIAI